MNHLLNKRYIVMVLFSHLPLKLVILIMYIATKTSPRSVSVYSDLNLSPNKTEVA